MELAPFTRPVAGLITPGNADPDGRADAQVGIRTRAPERRWRPPCRCSHAGWGCDGAIPRSRRVRESRSRFWCRPGRCQFDVGSWVHPQLAASIRGATSYQHAHGYRYRRLEQVITTGWRAHSALPLGSPTDNPKSFSSALPEMGSGLAWRRLVRKGTDIVLNHGRHTLRKAITSHADQDGDRQDVQGIGLIAGCFGPASREQLKNLPDLLACSIARSHASYRHERDPA